MVDKLPIAIVYASWSGLGIFTIAILGYFIFNQTLRNTSPKYMSLTNNKYLYYSNSTMVSGNVIGHSGYGGQFLAINLKTGNVAAFFSVLETKSATKESYKVDMINMLVDIVNNKY